MFNMRNKKSKTKHDRENCERPRETEKDQTSKVKYKKVKSEFVFGALLYELITFKQRKK